MREDRSIVLAEINSWEQKRNIMSKKKELEKIFYYNRKRSNKKGKGNRTKTERDSKRRKRQRSQKGESRIQENPSKREMI